MPEESITDLATYIKDNQKKFIEISYRDKCRNSRNDSFIDYLLRAVFECYIQDFGVSLIFIKCNECGIFDKKNIVGKSFIRNFTCASGNLYNRRKDFFKREYIELIWQLGKSEKNMFTAMFLITNVLQKGNYEKSWDDRLEKPFIYLWENKAVQGYFIKMNEVKWILKQIDGKH